MDPTVGQFSLFDYADYRLLLRDYCRHRRAKDRSFTIRGFLASAGFTGPNYLKEVIDGKKNLSPDGAQRLAEAMGLNAQDASYFLMLVDFNQGRDPDRKRKRLHELTRAAENTPAAELARDQYALLANWHNIAVREYLRAHPSTDRDLGKIGSSLRPKLGKREVIRAIRILERLNLIYQDGKGVWQQTDAILTTGKEVADLAARDHHQAMLGLAQEAMDHFPSDQRYYRAITGSFSRKAYSEIVEELYRARSRILEIIAEDQDSERSVYHIGMQLFPLEEQPNDQNAKRGDRKS